MIFIGLLAVLGIGSIVLAIMTAVSASRYPDWAFQQTGGTKFVWIVIPLLLIFLCWLGGGIMGIIWFSSKRDAVARAAQGGAGGQWGYGQPPPAGWGPPPASGTWAPPGAQPYPPPYAPPGSPQYPPPGPPQYPPPPPASPPEPQQ